MEYEISNQTTPISRAANSENHFSAIPSFVKENDWSVCATQEIKKSWKSNERNRRIECVRTKIAKMFMIVWGQWR